MKALSLHFQGVLETFGGFGMMAGPAIGGFLYAVSFYIYRPSVKPSRKTLAAAQSQALYNEKTIWKVMHKVLQKLS